MVSDRAEFLWVVGGVAVPSVMSVRSAAASFLVQLAVDLETLDRSVVPGRALMPTV
jgi:hypothetical protein